MAKPDLTQVYEALRVAEAEGRTEDVTKLIEYIDSVQALPDTVVEESYDPRELISPVIPSGVGAASGAVVPKLIESGVNAMEAGRKPQGALGKAPISINGVPEGHTPYNPKGRSVEGSIQNWRSYNEAQLEAAKKVRQESAMHKKYPGFTRAGTNPVLAPLEKNAAPIERAAARILPGGVSDIANFAKGVYDYKLPFIGSVGSLLGRSLVGAGAGFEAADAYNRAKMGDTTGSVISGLGSIGTAASLIPHPLAKVLGTGAGLSAEAINAYRDAMREGRIEHGAPENYDNINPAGDTYAQGGSVQHYQTGRLVKAAQEFILPAAENAARTQIIGTLPTYKKAADIFAKQGATGQALDFGAGLGKGAELLGPNTHTYEPFAQGWNPTYSNAADIPSDAYGRLTNLNVLNVVPRDVRDQMVLDIGRTMEPGGAGIITTRGADVMKAKGRPGPEPTSIITSRDTYQKGFTKQELEDYLRYMLGQGYDINKLNLGPAGAYIQKKAAGGDVNVTAHTMPSMSGQPGVGYMQTPQGAMMRMQLEQELANRARLRAGATGMGMAIPGQQGVKLMPGNIEAGANFPIGSGNLDISAYRSINPVNMPAQRGGHMQGANVRYTLPFSEGGLACLAQGGQPPKSDANGGSAFIGYPHINKNRKIGSGTGFLDALVGAPPSRENILNPSDYSYMEGYEKGEPYGIAAMVAPFLGPAVKPLAKEIGKRAFMGESLAPKALRGLMPEAPAMGIFKNEKGGNWAPEAMLEYSGWTPEQQLAETLGFQRNSPELENWVNTQLTRYVKNEMGSPGDPIRALADKGILHFKPRPSRNEAGQKNNVFYHAEDKRDLAGMPEGESALTQLGKDWENNVDLSVNTHHIGDDMIQQYGDEFPWLKKLKGQKLNSIEKEFMYSNLGFEHIVDVLREQIRNGQLRPESLKSLSVPQAVQRVHDYNLAKEKAMQKVQLQAQSELPVAKDYSDQGFKWLELKHPTDPSMTEKALKYEGDAMGHCVGGYCPEVLSGNTKIYSLRDVKGEPHVTIEVQPGKHPIGYGVSVSEGEDFPKSFRYEDSNMNEIALPKEQYDAIYNRAKEIFAGKGNVKDAADARYDSFQQAANEVLGELPARVKQIKGKQNVKPKDEYQPFITDFLKSGKWSQVDDIHNTHLFPDQISQVQREKFNKLGIEVPKLMTEDEYRELMNKIGYAGGGVVGYAGGGDVNNIPVEGDELDKPNFEKVFSQVTKGYKAPHSDRHYYKGDVQPALNVGNPNYLLGTETIKVYPQYQEYNKSGFYDGWKDPKSINISSSEINPYNLPSTVGHEAQHLQANLAYENPDKLGFIDKMRRAMAVEKTDDIKNQIEKNFEEYRKQWKSNQANQENNFGWGMKTRGALGAYGNSDVGSSERYADYAGLEAQLPRGQRLVDTELGKAVFKTPEQQNYLYQTIRPMEAKLLPQSDNKSAFWEGLNNLVNEYRYNVRAGKSHADSLIKGGLHALKKKD